MTSLGIGLLVSILKENRIQDFIQLKPELFVGHEQTLYNFLKEFYIAHASLPTEETIAKKFKFTYAEASEPYSYLYDEVNKRYLYSNLTKIITELSPILDVNPEEAFSKLKSSLFELEMSKIGIRDEIITFGNLAPLVVEDIRFTRARDGLTGVTTGWSSLDRITHGYQKGDIYVYVARVKTGKSMAILYSADAGHKAGNIPLVISMEMKIKQFAKRHLSLRSGIGHNYLKSGLLSGFAELQLERTIEEIQSRHPFYYVEGQLKKDISDIASMIHMYRPHVVFIDGGYLIDVDSYRKQRWEELEIIMKALKSIAIKSDVPIVLTFQFKRDMLKKKQIDVGLEDIRLSDDIGAITSVGIGIFDKSPYESDTTEDVLQQRKYLDVIGGREGESGGFYINWDWERMDFSEIDNTATYDLGLSRTMSVPHYDIGNLIDNMDQNMLE